MFMFCFCACFVLSSSRRGTQRTQQKEIMRSHDELSRKSAAAVNLVLRTLCPAAVSCQASHLACSLLINLLSFFLLPSHFHALTMFFSLSFLFPLTLPSSSLQRTRRVQKFTRAVSGMDVAALKKRQTEKKSKRESARKLQLQEIKDRKKKAKAERKKTGGSGKAKAIQGGRGKN